MRTVLLLCGSLSLTSCTPELAPGSKRLPAGVDAGIAARLDAIPPLEADGSAVPVTQLLVTSETAIELRTVALVEGDVSDTALRGFHDGAPPAKTRVVPTAIFRADDGVIVVAPRRPLADAPHTVVLGSALARLSFRVRATNVPVLARAFPPAESPFATNTALFCADAALPPAARALGRARPGATVGVDRGAFGDAAFDRCVTVTTTGAAPVLPVALYASGAVIAALEPTPLGEDEPPPALADASCGDDLPLGPICAVVDDDRVLLARAASPLLALAHAGDVAARGVLATPLVLRGLTPATPLSLTVRLVDVAGRTYDASASVVTRAAHSRVVLNEVYARPFGPQPLEEWIELVNDGVSDVDLTGYSLLDEHGSYPLPSALLAAGAFALVVNDGYVPDPLDVPPAAGTLLVRVPHLGKHGLPDKGAALALSGPNGEASTFPVRKTTQGKSSARIRPELPDEAASWLTSTPTPGAPNE